MKKKALFFCAAGGQCVSLAALLLKKEWKIVVFGPGADAFQTMPHETIFADAGESANFSQYLEVLSEIVHAGNYAETENEIALLCAEIKFEQKKRDDAYASNFVSGAPDEKIASLILAACKNYRHIIVATDEADFETLSRAIEIENVTDKLRLYLAEKALNMLAAALAFSSRALAEQIDDRIHPAFFLEPYKKIKTYPSGASLYVVPKRGLISAVQKVQGPDVCEDILCDIDALLRSLQNFFSLFKNTREIAVRTSEDSYLAVKLSAFSDSVFAIAAKRGIPIGAALGESLALAFSAMHERSKSVSDIAVVAFSAAVDEECAEKILETNCICVIAPLFTESAKATLARKPCTLLMTGRAQNFLHSVRAFDGALLVKNKITDLFNQWHVVTKNFPHQSDIDTLAFARFMLLHAKPSAAVVAYGMSATGMCSCALRASDACFAALEHALENEKTTGEKSCVLAASDTLSFTENFSYFFDKGIRVIAEPGGDEKDSAFIDFCNARGMVLIFTKIESDA